MSPFGPAVYAVDLEGDELWRYPNEPVRDLAFYAAPAVSDDGMIYAGAYTGHLFALDAESGDLQWEFPAADGADGAGDGRIVGSPTIAGDLLARPDRRRHALLPGPSHRGNAAHLRRRRPALVGAAGRGRNGIPGLPGAYGLRHRRRLRPSSCGRTISVSPSPTARPWSAERCWRGSWATLWSPCKLRTGRNFGAQRARDGCGAARPWSKIRPSSATSLGTSMPSISPMGRLLWQETPGEAVDQLAGDRRSAGHPRLRERQTDRLQSRHAVRRMGRNRRSARS